MNDLITQSSQSFAPNGLMNLTDSALPEKQPVGEKYIVFNLDDKLYAVSARQVVEVIQPMPVTPLPKSPRWLSGIINLRGRIISVIDLSNLWVNQTSTLSPKSKFIFLRSANGEAAVTFAVDKLNEIVALPGETLQSIKPTDAPFLLGKIEHNSEEIHLLDADKIYSFICFCLETGH